MAKKTGRHKREQPLTAKERIMASEEWVSDGLDYCRDAGRWPKWEERIVQECDCGTSNILLVGACTDYAIHVIKGRWEKCEPFIFSDLQNADYLDSYMSQIGGICPPPWTSLEAHILAKTNPTYAILYAGRVLKGEWPDAEHRILESATSPEPHLFFKSLTLYQSDPEDMVLCPTAYCTDALGGRWGALEVKMGDGKCAPRVMWEYAREVIAGQLPADLHKAMITKSFEFPDDLFLKQYISEYGR